MLPDKTAGCPLSGFKIRCFDGVVEHKCPKWVQVLGVNPQTGKEEAFFGCNEQVSHLLQLEFNKRMNELGAAIESMRNGIISVVQKQELENAQQLIAEMQRIAAPAKTGELLIEDKDGKG